MTSRTCRVNTWASVLLVLVVADVILVGRSTGVRVRGHQTSLGGASPQQTDDHVHEPADDGDESLAALEGRVRRTLGLQNVAAGGGMRRHRASAAERVAVPEYMWKLYRRQQRANRERHHRPPTATGDSTHSPPYSANTIRSFVATSLSHSFTGEYIHHIRMVLPHFA